MKTLQEKAAVVTGAAKGIGRACATALSKSGAKVILADIDHSGAQAAAEAITLAGGQALAVACDVTLDGTFELIRDTALANFGRVDLVMNNVGVLTRGLPEHIPVQEWQRIIDINLLSVVRSNAVFVPLLIAQGSGHIVNTASFAGLYPYSFDRTPYVATKAAIIALSESLALYLRPRNVDISVLCPGPVWTNIFDSVPSFGPETPLRGPGDEFTLLDPADVAEMVVDAVLANRFIVPTHAALRAILMDRACDWDAFIDRQVRAIGRI